MFRQTVLLRRAERMVRRAVWRAVPSPKQARGDVSAYRTMLVGMFRRAERCSWECFGVLNHDREDGTEVSYSIAAAIGSKQNTRWR